MPGSPALAHVDWTAKLKCIRDVFLIKQFVSAAFERGVVLASRGSELPEGARVHMLVTPYSNGVVNGLDSLLDLDQRCDQYSIDSGGIRLTRDQLHQRNRYECFVDRVDRSNPIKQAKARCLLRRLGTEKSRPHSLGECLVNLFDIRNFGNRRDE